MATFCDKVRQEELVVTKFAKKSQPTADLKSTRKQ